MSYRCGTVKDSLLTLARLIPSCVATFLAMLVAPLQSALIKNPLDVWYNPRFTRFPDGFQFLGFSP
ncbi:MAG: hypothetical protein F6K50_17780 [Moorea sp. SIO3I7]|nr:hypothetical protein [Moorena sp. SIO3I7]